MSGNDGYTKVLLHVDGSNGSTTITDSCAGASPHTWTAHSSTISTSQSKFGGASLNCGAKVGYVDTPDSSDFTLGSSGFTIDCWFYRNGSDATNRSIAGIRNGSTDISWQIQLNGTNALQAQISSDGTTFAIVLTGTTTFTAVGWHHVALVRNVNNWFLFVDGIQEATTSSSITVFDSSSNLAVGNNGNSVPWDGWIDEFRLSVGISRWTSNFTPPTSAYDTSGSSELLLLGVG